MKTYKLPPDPEDEWILVDRTHGIPVYPYDGILADVTSDRKRTRVYDWRDNPAVKIRFFNAVLKRNFQAEAACES